MKTGLRLALSAAAAVVLAAPLSAQAQPGYGGNTVTCESQDGSYRECRARFYNAPVLVEQLSSTQCVEGRNWGSRGPGSVWVSGGCRARFADAYQGGGGYNPGYNPGGGNVVRCESQDGRHEECRIGGGGRVSLVRQLSDSPCIEGQTWGNRGSGTVWVNAGCRGVFGVAGWGGGGGSSETYRCESRDDRYNECRGPTRGRQVLVRQLSESACIEGRSWGSRNGGVWVQYGCRGEFAAAGGWGGGGNWGQGGGRYEVECTSEDRRYTQCNWDSRQGRPYVVEQYSSDACIEGSSWGYDRRGNLWVDRGCRARFGAR